MVFFAIIFLVNFLLTINILENSINLMVRFSKKKIHHKSNKQTFKGNKGGKEDGFEEGKKGVYEE